VPAVNASPASLDQTDLSRLGLFPLPNVVLFPSQSLSLHVFEPRYRRLVSDVLEHGQVLAVPRLKPGFDAGYYGAPPLFEVCGAGRITEYARLPDGRYNIVVQGLGRVRLLEELRSEPYRVARAEVVLDSPPRDATSTETARTELLKLLRKAVPHLPGPARDLEQRLRGVSDTGESADILAGTLIEDTDERQAVLEELDPYRRITWLIAHVHGLLARLTGASASPLQRMN
jgi:Lon protease-like protein